MKFANLTAALTVLHTPAHKRIDMPDQIVQAITGYRQLSPKEVEYINEIKALGEQLGKMVDRMAMSGEMDTRWVKAGQTHLQQGIMALVRAVAQPTSF